MAPIEEPTATRFFMWVPSIGMPLGHLRKMRIPQWRLLFGHDDLRRSRGLCASEGIGSIAGEGRSASAPRQLTVNSHPLNTY